MDTLRIKCKLSGRPLMLEIGVIRSLATRRENERKRKQTSAFSLCAHVCVYKCVILNISKT